MATIGESLPPEVLEYLNSLKGQLPPTSSAADPLAAKEAAQAAVDAASTPGSVTGSPAADSAAVFEDAGAIPTKSAATSAETLAGAAEPFTGAAGEAGGVVVPGELGAIAGKAAGAVAGPLAMAASMPGDTETATSSPMDGPVPGQPGKVFQGQDIVDAPPTPVGADSPNLVHDTDPAAMAARLPDAKDDSDDEDDTSTSGPKLASAPAAQAEVAKAADKVADSKGKLDPVLKQYLQDKQDLLDAQKKANQNRMMANFGRAGATLAHAVAGAPGEVDSKPFDALDAQAGQPVTDVQDRQNAALKGLQTQQSMYQTKAIAEESDPNSDVSKRTRAAYGPLLKMSGLDPASVNGLSAADIKATVDKPIEFSAKLSELKEVAAMRRVQFQALQDEKLRHQDETEGATIANKANFLSASSRSAVGQAANAKMKLARLNELLNDPNATPQDMNIAANDLAGAVSGGNATVSGTHGQEYKNLATDLVSKANYLMGTTIPAEQSAAKAHMLDVSKRIGAVSDSVIDQNMNIVKSGHAGWWSRHPDQAANIVSSVAASQPQAAPAAPAAGPNPGQTTALPPLNPGEVRRRTSDGKTAIFDSASKKFLRYE